MFQTCAEVYKTKNEFEAKTASASQLSIVTLLLIPARAIASQIGRKHNWVGADWTKAGLAAPAIGRPLPSKRGSLHQTCHRNTKIVAKRRGKYKRDTKI